MIIELVGYYSGFASADSRGRERRFTPGLILSAETDEQRDFCQYLVDKGHAELADDADEAIAWDDYVYTGDPEKAAIEKARREISRLRWLRGIRSPFWG